MLHSALHTKLDIIICQPFITYINTQNTTPHTTLNAILHLTLQYTLHYLVYFTKHYITTLNTKWQHLDYKLDSNQIEEGNGEKGVTFTVCTLQWMPKSIKDQPQIIIFWIYSLIRCAQGKLYTMQTVQSVNCTKYNLYTVQTVLTKCTKCKLHTVLAIHSTNCTQYTFHPELCCVYCLHFTEQNKIRRSKKRNAGEARRPGENDTRES